MSHSSHGECDVDSQRTIETQVLNSLMAEHLTLDQAATLMGVSTRHTRRMLAAYRRGELPQLPMATGAAELPMPLPRPWPAMWSIWRHQVRRGQPHPSQRVAERTRGHQHRQDHAQTHPGQCRSEESAAKTSAQAPGAPSEDAPGGNADPGGRQLPPVAGRSGFALHFADRRR